MARRARPRVRAAGSVQPSTAGNAKRGIRVRAIVIIFAGLLAYADSFSNPFVLDDERSILTNQQIRELWPLTVPLSPPAESPVARRPLVNLSFALNYAAGGLDAEGYHVANLGIHLLAALALFGVVRRTLALDRLAPRFGAHATDIAAASALLWMLHPLHTEVMNYVSQRTTSLMGLFFLLTLYCSLRGLPPAHGRWRAAAVLACAAGMACKESMVTAPVLVVLFDGVFVFGSIGAAVRRRRALYAGLASTWILLAALMASGGRTTVGFDAGVSPWSYLLNQFPVLLQYLRLAVWPRALVVDYGLPQPLAVADVLWPAAAIIVLAAATIVAMRYRPAAGFLGAAFFVTLAPTSSIVPIVTEVGAERRMYLPLAALVILVVCAAYRLGRTALPRMAPRMGVRDPAGAMRIGAWLAGGAVACVGALLATGTVLRNIEYESPESLARTVVERRPHGRAFYAFGNALLDAGRRDEALGYFRQSAADFPGARFALGGELLADGALDEGVRELRTFITLMPDHAAVGGARQMIATALGAQGNFGEAIAELRRALERAPGDPRAHALLGEMLLGNGNDAEAMRHLERAVALNHRDARTHDLLGTILVRQGRLTHAIVQFERAAALDHSYSAARKNLAAAQQLIAAGGR